jgi:DNA-binding IclR family transcriptional regulator
MIGTEDECCAPVRSVVTTLDVLECFASAEELGVSENSRLLGVAKSTAYRLLPTLCTRGVAEKNPGYNRYWFDLGLFEFGQIALTPAKLRQTPLPLIEELLETPETASSCRHRTAFRSSFWNAYTGSAACGC